MLTSITLPRHQVLHASTRPISHFLSYCRIFSAHCAFLVNIRGHTAPTSYAQAILDPHWRQAMHAKLEALQQNNTWSLVPMHVGCKWVYNIKYESDDYLDTFFPTTKLTTLRCLLIVIVAQHWFIHQLDVQNAFLHGDLHEVVYMEPPHCLR